MLIDDHLEVFQSRLRGIEWIKVSGIDSEILFWEDWFLGCYWVPSEPQKLRIQFKFN